MSSVHLLHFSPSPSVVGLVRSLPLTSHPVSSGAEEKCNGTRRRWVRDGHGQPLPSLRHSIGFPLSPLPFAYGSLIIEKNNEPFTALEIY